jgi:hypothetical protein
MHPVENVNHPALRRYTLHLIHVDFIGSYEVFVKRSTIVALWSPGRPSISTNVGGHPSGHLNGRSIFVDGATLPSTDIARAPIT